MKLDVEGSQDTGQEHLSFCREQSAFRLGLALSLHQSFCKRKALNFKGQVVCLCKEDGVD